MIGFFDFTFVECTSIIFKERAAIGEGCWNGIGSWKKSTKNGPKSVQNRSKIGPFGERRTDLKPRTAEHAENAESTRGNSLTTDFTDFTDFFYPWQSAQSAVKTSPQLAKKPEHCSAQNTIDSRLARRWPERHNRCLAGHGLLPHRHPGVIGAHLAGWRKRKLLKVIEELFTK